jgi:hypothetical protein
MAAGKSSSMFELFQGERFEFELREIEIRCDSQFHSWQADAPAWAACATSHRILMMLRFEHLFQTSEQPTSAKRRQAERREDFHTSYIYMQSS